MKKYLITLILAVIPAAALASSLEADRARQLPPVDAGAIMARMDQRSDIPQPVPMVSAGTRGEKARLSHKIYVTPVTADWKNTMLVKFVRGADINTVMYVLQSAGLSSSKFADNGDGFFVRIDIKDAAAPAKAVTLAEYSVVESVQVNRTVYAMMSSKAAPEESRDDKKLKVCRLNSYEKNTCVYKCIGGSTHEQPMQRPSPWDDQPVVPCPQIVFPF